MMDLDVRVMIILPVYNAVDVIEDTLKSIEMQTYNKEKIYTYVIDFGSTDGTYEKLLSYPSYHLGVHQLRHKRIERTMPADAKRIVALQGSGGTYAYDLLLEPGDILYPECIEKNLMLLYRNQIYNPAHVWCEIDMMDDKGMKKSPTPLFDRACMLKAKEDAWEYIKQGCVHEMFAFGHNIAMGYKRFHGYANEGRFWSKGLLNGSEYNAVYNPEVLICRRQKKFKDELEEILLRWERLVLFSREFEAKYKKEWDQDIIRMAEKGIAYYALWRCCKRNGSISEEEIMQCYDMAAVIYPEIQEDVLYQEFIKAKEKSDDEKINQIAMNLEEIKTKKAPISLKLE